MVFIKGGFSHLFRCRILSYELLLSFDFWPGTISQVGTCSTKVEDLLLLWYLLLLDLGIPCCFRQENVFLFE